MPSFVRSIAASLVCLLLPVASFAGTVTFQPSTANILNPERGVMKLMNVDSSSLTTLDSMRSNGYTVAWGLIVLNKNDNLTMGSARLTEIRTWLERAKTNRLKAIVRIVYHTEASFNSTLEPTLAQMQTHLTQLQQTFTDYNNIIAAYQAGSFGAYGEWYYTPFTSAADRKALIDKMFDVIPTDAFVMLRTPYYKDEYEQAGGLASRVFRIGHYNDCFLQGDPGAEGYTCNPPVAGCPTVAQWKSDISVDSQIVPVGGETCSDVRTICAQAQSDMDYLGWTYINTEWWANSAENFKTIFNYWDEQSNCGSAIRQKLGYRLELTSATVPDSFTPGQDFAVSVSLKNTGYSPMYSARPVYIKLLDATTNAEIAYFWTGEDSRNWIPNGTTYSFTKTFSLPATVTSSSIKLALWIPDEDTTLYAVPEYAIRLASLRGSTDVWESISGGINVLAPSITVNGTAQPCITIDGAFTDWGGAAIVDPTGDSGAAVSDVTSVWVGNDASSIFGRFKTAATSDFFGSSLNNIFIDTDKNPATGFPIGGIGSELMIQGGVGYDQRGGGFNEGAVNGLALVVAPTGAVTDREFKLSRTATYAVGGASVFGGTGFKLVLESETTSFVTSELAPNSGGLPYTYSASCSGGTQWTISLFDNFESGIGNYTDNGTDCALYTGIYSPAGSKSMEIRDDAGLGSTFSLTNALNMTAYNEAYVAFQYQMISMESGEDFFLEFNNGSGWQILKSWVRGTTLQNNVRYSDTVNFTKAAYGFNATSRIRFRCDASNDADWVYVDNITIAGR